MAMSSESELEGRVPIVASALDWERTGLLRFPEDEDDQRPSSPHCGCGNNIKFCCPSSNGLGVLSTAFFILTTSLMTIPLPFALTKTGFANGILLLILIPAVAAYTSILINRCWIILLERWPEKYRDQLVRTPYPAIGREAGGYFWEVLVWVCVSVANFANAVVALLLSSSALDTLLPGNQPRRLWLLPSTVIVMPMALLGTPKNSWPLSWLGGGAQLLTTVSSLVSISLLLVAHTPPLISASATSMLNATLATSTTPVVATATPGHHHWPHHHPTTITGFWVGASTILFTYSGMAVFPTLQHDMKKPRRWPLAISIAYIIAVVLSLAVAIPGFVVFGNWSRPNMLWTVDCFQSPAARTAGLVAAGFLVVSGVCDTALSLFPVEQDFEEIFQLSKTSKIFNSPLSLLTQSQNCG